jgi:ubiquitin carboxyl-terminal hydrolase 34
MTSIFLKFLFPPAFDMEETQEAEIKSPILHSETRALLYSIVLGLGSEPASQMRLIALTRDLLSEGEDLNTWSWGIAQTSKDYAYEPNQAIERYKLIRSPTGYAGMRNLSNTCYLNSLFTQLFMNPNFRECILNADVTDPEDKQKLLHEIQKLFAAMQETWLKAVDPMSVSEAVITYEGTPIDVSLQMDVDEFYNLLFDRLENQIATPQGKQQFRNFYGGQLVQQIKSKDCPHVSERLEPFSAIQCEIKGKSSLDESLKAYIEGEVMEGGKDFEISILL